jgi:hypothetical protein
MKMAAFSDPLMWSHSYATAAQPAVASVAASQHETKSGPWKKNKRLRMRSPRGVQRGQAAPAAAFESVSITPARLSRPAHSLPCCTAGCATLVYQTKSN